MNDVNRLQEASEWVQRLTGSATDADFIRWQQWCDTHPENVQAFAQMQEVWEGLSPARVARVVPSMGLMQKPARRFRIGARQFAVAATLLVALSAAAWVYVGQRGYENLQTRIGETRQEQLADGSRLYLGAASTITLKFSQHSRSLNLGKGQGYFSVARDPRRPFKVRAGQLLITAVGTAFDVRMGSGSTVVTVDDGRIKVEAPEFEQPLYIDAGRSLRYSMSQHTVAVREVKPELAESWRQGVLQFQEEPLQDVVDAVNRYSQQKIVLKDQALALAPFTGTISLERLDDWFMALERILPVEVQSQDMEVVIARRRH